MADVMTGSTTVRDIHNIRRNITFAVLEFGTSALLLFISYRIVIADTGLEMLGLWSNLLAWTSLLRIGDLGVSGTLVRYVALIDRTDRTSLERHIGTTVVATSALFLVIALLGYFALGALVDVAIPAHLQSTASTTLPLLLVSFLLSGITGSLLAALTGLHYGYLRSILVIAGTTVQLILVVVMVPVYGLPGLATAQVTQALATIVVAWLILRRIGRLAALLPITFHVDTFVSVLRFSLSTQAATLANGLFEPLSKLIFGHFAGLSALGVYELAFKTIFLSRSVVVVGTSALVPSMTVRFKHSYSDAIKQYYRVSKITVLAAIGSMLAALLATPIISLLWMNELKLTYILYCAILAGGSALNAWGAAAYNLGIALGTLRNNVLSSSATLVVMMIAGYAMGQFGHTVGVVISISAAWGLGGVLIKQLNESLMQSRVPA